MASRDKQAGIPQYALNSVYVYLPPQENPGLEHRPVEGLYQRCMSRGYQVPGSYLGNTNLLSKKLIPASSLSKIIDHSIVVGANGFFFTEFRPADGVGFQAPLLFAGHGFSFMLSTT